MLQVTWSAELFYCQFSYIKGWNKLINVSFNCFPAEEILCCREDEKDHTQVLDCAWNPHQDILACSTTIGTVQLITCRSSRFGSSFQTQSVQFDLCPLFCLDWDVSYGILLVKFQKWISSLQESGKCLAIGSDSGIVYLWSEASAPLLLEGHDNCVKSVKWNRFGAPKLLISSSTNGVPPFLKKKWIASFSVKKTFSTCYQSGDCNMGHDSQCHTPAAHFQFG